MKITSLIPLALSFADLIQAEVVTSYSNEVLTSIEYITTRVPQVYTITDAAGSVITSTNEAAEPTAATSSSIILSNVTVALAFSSIAAGETAGTASASSSASASASNSIIPTGSVSWPNITTSPPSSVQLTVSTGLSTVTFTVTHCDNNPGCQIGSVTTEVVEYTTTCPVGTNSLNSTVFLTVPHTVTPTETGIPAKITAPSTLLTYSKATKSPNSKSKPSFSATGDISGAKTTKTGHLPSSVRFSNSTSTASKSIPTPSTASGYKLPPTGPLQTLIPVAVSSDSSGAVPSYFPQWNSTSETAARGTASASVPTRASGRPHSYSVPHLSYGTSVAPSSSSSAEIYSTDLSEIAPGPSTTSRPAVETSSHSSKSGYHFRNSTSATVAAGTGTGTAPLSIPTETPYTPYPYGAPPGASSAESAAAYSTNLSAIVPGPSATSHHVLSPSSSSSAEGAVGYSTVLSAVNPGPSVTIPTRLPSTTAKATAEGSTRPSAPAACVTEAPNEGGIVGSSGIPFSAGASITIDGTVYSFAANATGVLGVLSDAAPSGSANVTFVAPSAPSASTNWVRRFRA